MRVLNKTSYLNNYFQEDGKLHNIADAPLTGLSGIDQHLTIRPGVYLLGGLPSVGKLSQPTFVSN